MFVNNGDDKVNETIADGKLQISNWTAEGVGAAWFGDGSKGCGRIEGSPGREEKRASCRVGYDVWDFRFQN